MRFHFRDVNSDVIPAVLEILERDNDTDCDHGSHRHVIHVDITFVAVVFEQTFHLLPFRVVFRSAYRIKKQGSCPARKGSPRT